MSVDAALLISAGTLLVSLIFGLSNWKRGNKQDTKSDTTQLTTVIVKLENIKDGISEIKSDMKGVRSEVSELRERTAKNESSISSLHKRLDVYDKTIGKNLSVRKENDL